ncbi:type VII secretion protein EccCa [Mobilicoccus massiliensis]|uniref:type VII secretion protein EccCa n=1 Tax=Mobilicoccus massiliensis TaxID=1522310 RepID=UPI00058F2349|nr:type VII secretion protein EccCa [Mobilicoccus massiliensis]
MTVIARPARRVTPAPTPRRRTLDRPPTPPDPSAAGGLVQVILPALGGLGMVLFMIAGGNPLLLVAGLVMLVVTLGGAIGMAVSTRFGPRRRFALARERYLAELDEVRAELRTEAARQRRHDDDLHPDPVALLARVPAGRVGVRSRRDPHAAMVRIGVGPAAHPLQIALPDGDADPVTFRAMAALARSGRVLAGAPLVVDLMAGPYLLLGRLDDIRLLARAILLQSAAALGPEQLTLAIVTPDPQAYAWARWLPHLATADEGVCIGPLPPEPSRIPETGPDGRPLLHRIVVVEHPETGDLPAPAPGGSSTQASPGTCVLHLAAGDDIDRLRQRSDLPASAIEIVVEAGAHRVHVLADGEVPRSGVPDRVGMPFAETLARAVAAAAGARPPLEEAASGPLPPARVLGVDRLEEFDPGVAWARSSAGELLTVCIGRDETGREVRLDLKESARGGSGPHGVLVGATGSGKSELLRSLVLGLAATHHPDDLAFVLVDYKGGATFSGLERLPHVAGVVTNLGEDLGLVDRMHAALLGEIRRRQQVLHDAGRLTDVYAYREERRTSAGPGRLAPLPHLLVVIDEFAELLTAMPEVIDLFTTIGRIGRSIGVQQLLASQRLDDGRLRGLEAFLSYRIALRTFTAEESRAVIGSSLAAELPSVPGSGYVRTDRTVRFRAAYVAAAEPDVRRGRPAAEVIRWFERPGNSGRFGPDGTEEHHADRVEAPPPPAPASVLEVAVDRMEHAGPPARRVWSDPLPERVGVDDVWSRFGEPEPYVARIGLVDLPSEQTVAPLDLDLRRGSCHLAILGGPDTGRSTSLRTLAYALARRHTPDEVVVHGIDLDRRFPAVSRGAAARRLDRGATRRRTRAPHGA